MADTCVSLSWLFDNTIDSFLTYSEGVDLAYFASFFHNCSGDTIYEINAAIVYEDSMRSQMKSLIEATSAYLTVARDNIEECELDNS